MKAVTLIAAVTLTALSLTTARAFADNEPALASQDHCLDVEFRDHDIHVINAALYANLHIYLPFTVKDAIIGGGRLWAVEWQEDSPNVWVKPKNNTEVGATTSLTIIDHANHPYNFVVVRKEKPEYTCVAVELGGQLRRKKSNRLSPNEQRIADLQAQLEREKRDNVFKGERAQQLLTDVHKSAVRRVFADYRVTASIRTLKRLNIKDVREYVQSVHDDGTFTYVTFVKDAAGLISAKASYRGKEQLAAAEYHPLEKLQIIRGVYDSVTLTYDDAEITIIRGASDGS